MINYIKGLLISKIEDSPQGANITVENNGIGYFYITNKKTVNNLPKEGETVTIYSSLVHREDSMFLCGFLSREDRDLFQLLQSVSGVGTKVALFLIGELGAYGLIEAVLQSDIKSLTKAKGVGPKLAQKIVIELKDKMTNWRDKVSLKIESGSMQNSIEDLQSYTDTETVLLSLGYSKKEAAESLQQIWSKVKDNNDSEEVLKLALQWLVEQEG